MNRIFLTATFGLLAIGFAFANEKVTTKPRWHTIVVHHSGTVQGSAAAFDAYHRQRGWDGLGYHFVIGNGTLSSDGCIETGYRWWEQRDGAHAKEHNKRTVGICLVGDFNKTQPTPNQVRALKMLLNYLMTKYQITNVCGHRDVGQTDCPGKLLEITK